jgi:hypothetical protein
MKRCVSDHTLWLVSEGEAEAADRDHVWACAACSARYRQLEQDLQAFRLTLSGPPPTQRVWCPAPSARRRWMTAAAATAALVVVVWSSVWFLRSGATSLPSIGGQEAIWSFLAEVSLAVFAAADAEMIGELTGPAGPGLEPEATALSVSSPGAWPCDNGAWWFNVDCATQPFLFAEGR